MPSTLEKWLPGVETAPGKPAILRVDADPHAWAEHRVAVRGVLAEHGALLIRGLGLADRAAALRVARGLADELLVEREAFAPREDLGGGLYSATPWPANQPMCMHHELSYTVTFPGLLMFACLDAPSDGGATGVADAAAVLGALPADLVARFEREGWILTRSYSDVIGASWAEAFGTEDRAAVEAYCRANDIAFQWSADGLRTRQRRSAIVAHPSTGVRCWFNQIAFLSEWTLAEEIREYLVDEYGADGLPFNTCFGNGDPISADVVELLAETYEAHTVREAWQSGDLLLVDNIRAAHSREAYTGSRQVVVAMADPVHRDRVSCDPTVEVSGR